MGAVTHFEIYAEEPAKLADFYRNLFGWQLDKAPGIDYWRIQTGQSQTNAFNGGLTYRPLPGPRNWVHYVNVASLDEALAHLQRLGGTVLRPKSAVPKTVRVRGRGRPRGKHFRRFGNRTRQRCLLPEPD